MSSFIDTLRAACDNAAGIVSYKELSAYEVYLVTITNDQVNFDDSPSTRVRTNTRITVGASIAANLNPHVQYQIYRNRAHIDGTTVLSGAALTNMELMLGPLILPYNTGYQSGGLDPAVFQPGPTAAKNTSIYVQIKGAGLNQANGNYFSVGEVVLSGMDNTFYYVKLSGILDVIPQ